MQIHIARNGQPMGPFSLEEVRSELAAGTLSLSDQAWYEGAAGWAPLSTIPGVKERKASHGPSQLPGRPSPSLPAMYPAPAASTRIAAQTLAIMSVMFSAAGLLGVCCALFLVPGITGIIFGHLALGRAKSDPCSQGRGLALAGLIIGYAGLAVWLCWVLLFGGLAALDAMR